MEKVERVYELSYIESSEYTVKRGIFGCCSMGNLMMKKLRASNENGVFVFGEDQGEIREVYFLKPELNREEMREVIKPWDFNHKSEDEKVYSYQEFVSLGSPLKIRITTSTEVLETLEEVLARGDN